MSATGDESEEEEALISGGSRGRALTYVTVANGEESGFSTATFPGRPSLHLAALLEALLLQSKWQTVQKQQQLHLPVAFQELTCTQTREKKLVLPTYQLICTYCIHTV